MMKILNFNVMKFGDGKMGAVNGMGADWSILKNEEAKEVWVGTTLGYAGLLMSEDLKDEVWKTTWVVYEHYKAKDIYIFMGHHPDLFENPVFATIFRNSILWAVGQQAKK